jgi:hypothetical protein
MYVCWPVAGNPASHAWSSDEGWPEGPPVQPSPVAIAEEEAVPVALT